MKERLIVYSLKTHEYILPFKTINFLLEDWYFYFVFAIFLTMTKFAKNTTISDFYDCNIFKFLFFFFKLQFLFTQAYFHFVIFLVILLHFLLYILL